jgi:PPOX class probable F420-dependent enzyme
MEITLNDVAREVLDGPHIAAIATSNADGRPQTSVIFVKRDGDTAVFSTIKGRRKTRNMARGPRVSLLVVDKEKGRYVEIRGSVEICVRSGSRRSTWPRAGSPASSCSAIPAWSPCSVFR